MDNPTLPILWGRNGRGTHKWVQDSITWDEVVTEWTDPANLATVKDTTGYVFGTFEETTVVHKGSTKACTGLHRKRSAARTRSAIVIDADYPEADFLDRVADVLGSHAYLIHTTWSHTPENPRYRLLIPVGDTIDPGVHSDATDWFMEQIGIEQFDIKASSVVNQFAYLPAADDPDKFESWVNDGTPYIAAELFLMKPTYEGRPRPRTDNKLKRGNPDEIGGIIGAFNRVWDDWGQLIEAFDLPYECEGDDRYRYRGTHSTPGAGPIAEAPGLWYSHHASDPAAHEARSAFDLYRIHHFGHLDDEAKPGTPIAKLPSNLAAKAEQEEEGTDAQAELQRTSIAAMRADFGDAFEEDDDPSWLSRLNLNARDGSVRDTVNNWDLFFTHDPVLKSVWFNDMGGTIQLDRFPPGASTPDGSVTTAARDAIRTYLERTYTGFKPSSARLDQMINTAALERRRNPVREYLASLPEWDGVPRVETCMTGVTPTPYTRMVLRKALVGAVARIMKPGCKWDHVVVLQGPAGLGKTTAVEDLAGPGWSDTLGPITDKDTLQRMGRKWIMVADEGGKTLSRSDNNALKEFITRREDNYRAPYDRAPVTHPRHNVIWMTTNDKKILKDDEGNRRYLILEVRKRFDFDALKADRDQIWAEALHLYNNDEPTYLSAEESAVAAAERASHTEGSPLPGKISAALDRENYDMVNVLSAYDLVNPGIAGLPKDTELRRYEIALDQLVARGGWEQQPGLQVGPGELAVYGAQIQYTRVEPGLSLEDLL